MKRILRLFALGIIILFVAIQFIPYGRTHINPPATGEPPWNSPRTREIFYRACADCHSNETTWPWYSNVAPFSWQVQHDVDEGREHFNVSEWGRKRNHGDDAVEEVEEGKMPPPAYTWIHAEASLNPAEKDEFIRGLTATFGADKRSSREK